jgi:hypothetical protein
MRASARLRVGADVDMRKPVAVLLLATMVFVIGLMPAS